MPNFTNELRLECTADEAFAFLSVPTNRLQLTPPDWALELVAGPPRLETGARTTWRVRRFGLSHVSVLETVVCEPPCRLVEEQCQGPFRLWRQDLTVTPADHGVVLRDAVAYEPPGGLLGLLVTPTKIGSWLAESFAWRDRQLRLILESPAASRNTDLR